MVLFEFVIVILCFMGVPGGVPPGGCLIIIKNQSFLKTCVENLEISYQVNQTKAKNQ